MNFLFPHTLSWVTFFTKEILSDEALLVSMTLSMLSLQSSWGLSPPVDSFCFPRLPCEPGSEMTRQQKPQSCGAPAQAVSAQGGQRSAPRCTLIERLPRATEALCVSAGHVEQFVGFTLLGVGSFHWFLFVLCCGVLFCFLTFTVRCWFQSYNNVSEWVSGSCSVMSDSFQPHRLYSPRNSPG